MDSSTALEDEMFVSLNDDILHLVIFDYLGLEEQTILSQVCQQLRAFILSVWQRKWLCADLRILDLKVKPKIAEDFITTIANFCEAMSLSSVELNKYEPIFRKCSFPQLTALEVNVFDNDLKADEQILIISVLFPNINKLKLSGQFQGNYIYRLKHLKELHLELDGKPICLKHLERFLCSLPIERFTYNSSNRDSYPLRKISKCATLKELSINSYLRFYNSFETNLRHIRKVTFTDCLSKPYDNVYGNHIKRLVLVGVNYKIISFYQLKYFKKLRQLVLSEMADLDSALRIIYNIPPELVKFRYLESQWNDDIEDSLVDLLNRCSNLKLLDVSNTAAGPNFLHKLLERVDFKKHKEHFVLCCYRTNILPSSLELINLSKKVKLSFEKQSINLPTFGSIQIIHNV